MEEKKVKKEKKQIVVNFWAFLFLIGSLTVLVFVLIWALIALM